MRRPTIEQLNIVRSIAGNGWGDGDYADNCQTVSEKHKTARALDSFEKWLEHLQGSEFRCPLVAGKRRGILT